MFFLICGIVGSVVMTAASVQAKAAQTHVDLQQKEYAMQSAAKLMAQQLGGEDAVWEEKSVSLKSPTIPQVRRVSIRIACVR
ncbi:MAG: hypothetical protein ACLTMP_11885 [Eggerthella lenta]